MTKNPSTEEQLKELAQRLEGLERLVQSQIQRIFVLEQRRVNDDARPSRPSIATTEVPPPKTPAAQLPSPRPAPEFEQIASRSRAAEGSGAGPQDSLEAVIGGNWLNKIGIAAIILGMAYFLRYSIENRWIGEMGRIILGTLTGLGLLLGGEALQRKQYRGYGITIASGGVAILYFSIFAAFNFYNLIAQLPALFLMVLITTSAVLTALRYDARVMAWIGILGGFLTPVMLSTGRDNQVGLFIYVALLDLGVLALAYFKKWRALNLLAFVLTQLTFLAWSATFYTSAKLWRTELFFTVFFLIFGVISILYNIVHKEVTRFPDLVLIFSNGATYFLWTYALMEQTYFDYLGLYAVLMAVSYVLLGWLAHQRSRQDSLLFLVLLAMALTSLTLAIPIQLKQNWITIGWAVEAVILTWVGFHLSDSKLRLAAFCVACLVAIRLLFYDQSVFLSNKRAFSFAVGILAILAMAYLYNRHRDKLVGQEAIRITGLVLAANFLLIFFFTTEIGRYFRSEYERAANHQLQREISNQEQLSVSALWAVYSIILSILGIIKRYQPIRLFAIVLFGLTIFKVFLLDLSNLERIYRIVSFIGLGVILLVVSFIYQKHRNQINDFVLK